MSEPPRKSTVTAARTTSIALTTGLPSCTTALVHPAFGVWWQRLNDNDHDIGRSSFDREEASRGSTVKVVQHVRSPLHPCKGSGSSA